MNNHKLLLAVSLGCRIVSGIVSLFVLARTLGPTDYGLMATVFAYSTVVSILTDFGYPTKLLRDIAAQPAQAGALTSEAIRVKSALVIIATLAATIALLLLQLSLEIFISALLLYSSIIFASYSDLVLTSIRATGKPHIETIVVVIGTAIYATLPTLAAIAYKDILLVSLAIFSSRIAQTAIAAIAISPHITLKIGKIGSVASILSSMRKARGLAADGALLIITGQIDIILVSALLGVTAAGTYQIPARLASYFLMPSGVLTGTYIPVLSKIRAESPGQLRRREDRYLVEYLAVGVAAGTLFTIVMPLAAPYVVGTQFEIPIELWVAFGALVSLRYMTAILGTTLIVRQNVKVRVYGQAVGAVVLIALICAFAPPFGMSGAGWSLSASIALMAAVYLWALLGARKKQDAPSSSVR